MKFAPLLCLLLFCVGCSGSSDLALTREALRFNIQGDPNTLHPHKGVDMKSHMMQRALLEGLTRIGPDLKPHLAAAEKVEISDNKKEYFFSIRPHLWTNGDPVTAHDFERTWKEALAPGSACLRADLFYGIKNGERAKKGEVSLDEVGISALSDSLLRIELEHPAPFFLEMVSSPLFSPLHASWVEGKEMIGNGSFVIDVWEHESQIVLVPNPTYWDRESIEIKRVEISCVADPNTTLMMFEKGEIDWGGSPFGEIPFDCLSRLKEQGILQSRPVSGSFWFSLNTKTPPLGSPKLRKALAYAMDRQAICDEIYFGKSLSYSPLPSNIGLNSEETIGFAYDPELARTLLAEGIWDLGLEELPPIILDYSDICGQKRLAESIQRNWKENLGIEVKLRGSDWNTFFTKLMSGDYQVMGCIWFAAYNDPHYVLDFFKDVDTAYNITGWEDLRYRLLIGEATLEADIQKRTKLLSLAEQILIDEMPIIPLHTEEFFFVKNNRLEGLVVTDSGRVDFKWAKINNKD